MRVDHDLDGLAPTLARGLDVIAEPRGDAFVAGDPGDHDVGTMVATEDPEHLLGIELGGAFSGHGRHRKGG
jgi:hypothetical protein